MEVVSFFGSSCLYFCSGIKASENMMFEVFLGVSISYFAFVGWVFHCLGVVDHSGF